MVGLTENEKKQLFDGLRAITKINCRLIRIETTLEQTQLLKVFKNNNFKFKITTVIAIIAVAWSIVQPFVLKLI